MLEKTIIVNTQKDLDKIKLDFKWRIEIRWDIEKFNTKFNNADVVLYWSIKYMSDSASIQYMYGSASIQSMYGSASIQSMYGSASIQSMSGSASIQSMSGSASIQSMYDSASIQSMYGSASIQYMYDSASIQSMYGSASIKSMSGSASIKSMYDSASIKYMSGSASILLMTWLASIILLKSAKKIIAKGMNLIRQIGTLKIDMELWKDVNFIQIKDTIENTPTFEMYKKLYPVDIKKTKAILYKAVHKIDWEYISNYDKSFEYEIWKIIKEKCDNNKTDSCSYWIHISHLKRAIDFGRVWEDMAILECEVPIKDIVVSKDCDWKVRTSQLKVLRELPKEER